MTPTAQGSAWCWVFSFKDPEAAFDVHVFLGLFSLGGCDPPKRPMWMSICLGVSRTPPVDVVTPPPPGSDVRPYLTHLLSRISNILNSWCMIK